MKQTVTGRFKTWDDARHAQDALMLMGFAAGDIELPAQTQGVLAGLERLVASFFAADPLAGGTGSGPAEASPLAPGDTVLLAVHVMDDARAELARATFVEARAIDVTNRGDPWNWATRDNATTREHSAIDELGLADLATAVRRRAAASSATTGATREAPAPTATTAESSQRHRSDVVASASAPGAGAVMSRGVEVPAAPEATQPAKGAAPQIPDEFLEYEDDTPAHHRTLH
ncbi:hypothetical protein [Paraburkholderia sp. J12]|uniref:hypothetical protein n=1 Tax=Paraburkholderia sp. J12 TaxID=2805432 RepID=UPI002ABDC453|nr:hypothetical protein [Paraburkholderia sp. J12]